MSGPQAHAVPFWVTVAMNRLKTVRPGILRITKNCLSSFCWIRHCRDAPHGERSELRQSPWRSRRDL